MNAPDTLPAVPDQHTPRDLMMMAEQVAKSRLFPGFETPQAAFALMLLCQSEGLHPMQAVRRFHLINGKPSMRADAMQAEYQRQGGTVRWLKSDAGECRARFLHPVHAPEPGLEIEWTIARAGLAGLTGNPTWKKFPAQMLRARVISEGVRAVLPGVVCGIYTPEEVGDFAPPRQPEPAPVIETTAVEVPPTADQSAGAGKPFNEWLDGVTEIFAEEGVPISKWQIARHLHKAYGFEFTKSNSQILSDLAGQYGDRDGFRWLKGEWRRYLATLKAPVQPAATDEPADPATAEDDTPEPDPQGERE
jgi:hypothetical protein